MKRSLLATTVLILGNYLLLSQEMQGTGFCLLFDSELEKQAFLQDNIDQSDELIFLLADDPGIDSIGYFKIKNELTDYSNELRAKKKRFKSEQAFLRHLFINVHNKYLKHYQNPKGFSGIFNTRSYNCVSGTALYAYLLEQLGYCINIMETRFHLFLIVELGEASRIMIETTDPFGGFVMNEESVEDRINKYLLKEKMTLKENKKMISAPFDKEGVFQSISFQNLGGLHYYNKAVDLVNRGEYAQALPVLKKAYLLYSTSARIHHFLWFAENLYEQQLSAAFTNR
jgi:hypothetical protein